MRKLWVSMLAVLAVVSFASPAAAAANPYTYSQLCGSGYNLVSGGAIDLKTSSGALYGQLYITWNGSARMNCVVVIKRAYVGTRSETSVSISSPNSEGGWDLGNYTHYAGPVYEDAAGKCIYVSGWVWNPAKTVQAKKSVSGWCS